MFSLEQLEAFMETVESGSFSNAARQLKKAQSVVSQHVMNLEIDCGVELFDRSGRYPVLTAEGSKLLPYARATILQHRRLKHTALSLFGRQSSEVCLAMDEGIPIQRISEIIQLLESDFPNIELEFLSASSIDIIDMVHSGRASTGLIFSELSMPSSIDFESIGVIEFDLYVASSHPLAKSVAPNMDSLRLYRQLCIRSRNTKTSSFQQAFSPDVWYADNYYVLLELALQGHGWCLLPEHMASSSVSSGNLTRVPIEFEQIGWYANVDVIQHQDKSSQPLLKRLRQLFRELLVGQK